MKKKIISGIQATSSLTLGNYIGAIKPLINLQNDNDLIVFIADMHSITVEFIPNELKKNRETVANLFVACGLNPNIVKIFYQSSITEHTELQYILSCHSYLGELNRMTQFKDKSKKVQNNKTTMIPTGLLIYPTLMASDILLYDVDCVVVGSDQIQHIELTRNLAQRMNKKYNSNLFKIPEPIVNKIAAKIMDLQQPEIKMSKSNSNHKGVIFLLDDIEEARKKIISAKTDNLNQVKYDRINQPGISNLIVIYSEIENISIDEIEKKYTNKNYAEFKKDVADSVTNFLKKIQNNYNDNLKNKNLNELIIKNGYSCKKVAIQKINDIHKILGLYYDKNI